MAAAVALADRHYKVVIVGSGLSALQTARSLIDSYRYDPSSILLLEANDYVGGRVKQSLTFVEGVPVDLGAEILHGGNTLLAEYAKTIGEEIEQIYCWAHGDGGPLEHPINGGYGLYYFPPSSCNPTPRMLRYDDSDEEFKALNELFWDLGLLDEKEIPQEKSLRDHMEEAKLSREMIAMGNAGYANTLCANCNELSLQQSVRWSRIWGLEAGENGEHEGDFRYKNSYKILVDYLSRGLNIITSCPVDEVDYNVTSEVTNKVRVKARSGDVYYSEAVVVTASPHVLRSPHLLRFAPSLPLNKQEALSSIHINRTLKILLKFSRLVWPKKLKGMVIAVDNLEKLSNGANISQQKEDDQKNCFIVPEIFFHDLTNHHSRSQAEEACCYCVGFTTAAYADQVAKVREEKGDGEVFRLFLMQMDSMWDSMRNEHLQAELNLEHEANTPVETGTVLSKAEETVHSSGSSLLPKPSEFFLGGLIQAWTPTDVPFIGGGYGSARSGYPLDAGFQLSIPVADEGGRECLFFAGEATSIGAGATAHSALATGIRAAEQVCKAMQHQINSNNEQ